MPDPIEELRRYGAAVEAATPVADVGGLVAVGAPSRGTAADEVDLAGSPADAGRSRRPWLIAAAGAVIVALGAAALVTRPDDDDADDLEVVDDPAGETFGYGPGWHELDPGPLPESGASVTWTGDELVVLGGERTKAGAAYNPATRAWRAIAEPPFLEPPEASEPSYGGSWQAAWTGEELVVVANTGTPRWEAAAYHPASDSWRPLPDPPTEFTDGGPSLGPDAVWTGTEVLFMSSLVALDPVTGDWRIYPPREPTDALVTERHQLLGGSMAMAWTGDRVVYLSGPERPTHLFEPLTRTWTEHASSPLDGNEAANQGSPIISGVWDGQMLWAIDDSGSTATFDPTISSWVVVEERTLASRGMCHTQAVLVRDQPLLAACDAMFHLSDSATWSRYDQPSAHSPSTLVSTGDVLLSWAPGRADETYPQEARFRLWVPPPETEAPSSTSATPPPSDPTATAPTTSADQSEPPDSQPGPTVTVIAGDVEGRVAPVGGYCWLDAFEVLERCATDPSSKTDVDRVLSIEPGGQLHVVLPEAGTIRSDLSWNPSGEECGRLERTITTEASTQALITGTIPGGTHTVSFEVTVGDDTHRYQLTLDAGEGPVCTDEARRSQARLLPPFDLFGLTREELATEYGEWRDVTHGRDDRPRLLELDVAFEDGRVRFAEINFSGRTPILEGVEELEDLPYLGLTIEEAEDLARAEGRELCVWLGACRTKLDRSRLQFHTAEVGDETRVVGIYRS